MKINIVLLIALSYTQFIQGQQFVNGILKVRINSEDAKPILNKTSGQHTKNARLDNVLNKFDTYKFIKAYPGTNDEYLKKIYIIRHNSDNKQFKSELSKLIKEGIVDNISEIPMPIPTYEPSDNLWDSTGLRSLWHLRNIQADKAWDITKGSSSVKIAIIDSDFDLNHPDLKYKISPNFDLYDSVPHGSSGLSGSFTHGTIVASFAAAHTDGGGDLASAGFNCMMQGYTWGGGLQKAHYASLNQNVNVISISFFTYCSIAQMLEYHQDTAEVRKVIKEIIDHGTVIVASAANGPCHCGGGEVYPFSKFFDNRIIKVSGTYDDNKFARTVTLDERGTRNLTTCGVNVHIGDQYVQTHSYYSSVDICAPGHNVTFAAVTGTNVPYPYYCCGDGTSYATPIVAGVVGLMLSANPCLTVVQVKDILKRTCDPILDANIAPYIGKVGAGRINAYKAVKEAATTYIQNTTLWAPTTKDRTFVDIGSDVTNLYTTGTVKVGPNSSLTINAREVTIKNDFEVPLGSTLTINTSPTYNQGCP